MYAVIRVLFDSFQRWYRRRESALPTSVGGGRGTVVRQIVLSIFDNRPDPRVCTYLVVGNVALYLLVFNLCIFIANKVICRADVIKFEDLVFQLTSYLSSSLYSLPARVPRFPPLSPSDANRFHCLFLRRYIPFSL